MLDNEQLKRYIYEMYRYTIELVNEGHITRADVDDKRKDANADADMWVERYGDRLSKSAKEELHIAVFGLHFVSFVRNLRIKLTQIKMDSPDWFHHVKRSVNGDGTVSIVADYKINRLNNLHQLFSSCADSIIDMVWASHGLMGACHGIYPRG